VYKTGVGTAKYVYSGSNLSMLTCIQPSVAALMFNDNMHGDTAGSGLAQRFLYCFGRVVSTSPSVSSLQLSTRQLFSLGVLIRELSAFDTTR
jgi:hypothetical protein